LVFFSCSSSSISTFIPSDAGFWVSSTTGVGFIDVISGEGILSILTISDSCCSLSCDCTYALVLTLECLVVWPGSACFGGAMVGNMVIPRAP
jgi:hypothetical protein